MKQKRQLTLTVSIITCYGGKSILDTVASIRASYGVGDFRFILLADREGLEPTVKDKLKKYGVEVYERRGEQMTPHEKWRSILKMTKSDVLVLTQDDVIFEPNTLAKVMSHLNSHPESQFLNIRNIPVDPNTWFEQGVNVGTRLVNRIGELWNEGDNYLGLLGRGMVVRTSWFRKFNLPDDIVSSDAYFYFINKRLGGKYENMKDAKLYFRNPQIMREHLQKSSRFQHSKLEMSKYFNENLDSAYHIPLGIAARAVGEELLLHPIATAIYSYIWLYTRLFKHNYSNALTANWEIDHSTKQVLINHT